MVTGLVSANPAVGLARALRPVVRSGRQPAVTTLDEARELYRRFANGRIQPETRAAMLFLALTAQRPGVVRHARWADIDGSTWRVPMSAMKGGLERKAMGGTFDVPLAPQAMDLLAGIRPLTGHAPWLFPTPRWSGRALSENALCYYAQREGLAGRHLPHGWRATLSTVMNERFPADRAVIDLMLGHLPGNRVEAAYNRSLHMDRRRELACAWADLLTG